MEHRIAPLGLEDIPRMEAELARRGVAVAEMCRRAAVAETTWGRWKRREFMPRMSTWQEICVAYWQLVEGDEDGVASMDAA